MLSMFRVWTGISILYLGFSLELSTSHLPRFCQWLMYFDAITKASFGASSSPYHIQPFNSLGFEL